MPKAPEQARATKPWTVMIYMIADDPAGGALLDQQANRELDQIVHGALSVNRDQLVRRGSVGLPQPARCLAARDRRRRMAAAGERRG